MTPQICVKCGKFEKEHILGKGKWIKGKGYENNLYCNVMHIGHPKHSEKFVPIHSPKPCKTEDLGVTEKVEGTRKGCGKIIAKDKDGLIICGDKNNFTGVVFCESCQSKNAPQDDLGLNYMETAEKNHSQLSQKDIASLSLMREKRENEQTALSKNGSDLDTSSLSKHSPADVLTDKETPLSDEEIKKDIVDYIYNHYHKKNISQDIIDEIILYSIDKAISLTRENENRKFKSAVSKYRNYLIIKQGAVAYVKDGNKDVEKFDEIFGFLSDGEKI